MSKKKILSFSFLVIVAAIVIVGGNRYGIINFNGSDRESVMINYEEANSYLVLVNQYNKLESDFSPNDLVLLNVVDFRNNPNTTIYMRATAAHMVEQLFQSASDEAGLLLLARSGYRSYQTQEQVHQRFVNERGQEEADRFSARPGHSEHQTGLALDVTANSVNGELVQWFSDTPEGNWLKHNAHRFGFIISYPEGRESETGFVYEPWHIRYVGIEAATEIYENGLILEEYLR